MEIGRCPSEAAKSWRAKCAHQPGVLPEIEEAQLYTRIISSPRYAKELLTTLQESIEHHENSYGSIKK